MRLSAGNANARDAEVEDPLQYLLDIGMNDLYKELKNKGVKPIIKEC